jgi:hypothetical protein
MKPKHGWIITISLAVVLIAIFTAPDAMGDNLGPAAGKLGHWTLEAIDKTATFITNLFQSRQT